MRRIFCVGRNFAEHAREMGTDPDRDLPFFFTKPADVLVTGGADMPDPPASNSLHHEMEPAGRHRHWRRRHRRGRGAGPCVAMPPGST